MDLHIDKNVSGHPIENAVFLGKTNLYIKKYINLNYLYIRNYCL